MNKFFNMEHQVGEVRVSAALLAQLQAAGYQVHKNLLYF